MGRRTDVAGWHGFSPSADVADLFGLNGMLRLTFGFFFLFPGVEEGAPPLRVFDPGYKNTAAARSAICYIDGPKVCAALLSVCVCVCM